MPCGPLPFSSRCDGLHLSVKALLCFVADGWAYRLTETGARMSEDAKTRITEILEDRGADAQSADELMGLVYDQLRRLAQGYLMRERAGHTLDATALVHEAYEKLVDQRSVDWNGRSHFFAVGAQAMRRLLVDHARGRGREKRGGSRDRVTLDASRLDPGGSEPGVGQVDIAFEELLELDDALTQLATLDPRAARIVELRYFSGLTVPEVAEALEISVSTVEGDWRHARSWLRRTLSQGAPD